MKSKRLAMMLVALIALTSVTVAQSSEKDTQDVKHRKEITKRHGERGGDRADNFFTEEQKEQIKALRLEAATKIKPLRNELRELKAHQQTLETADNADMKAIYKNIDSIAGVQAELQKIRAEEQQKIRSLLTEEQLLKFDSMKGKMWAKRRGAKGGPRSKADRQG